MLANPLAMAGLSLLVLLGHALGLPQLLSSMVQLVPMNLVLLLPMTLVTRTLLPSSCLLQLLPKRRAQQAQQLCTQPPAQHAALRPS